VRKTSPIKSGKGSAVDNGGARILNELSDKKDERVNEPTSERVNLSNIPHASFAADAGAAAHCANTSGGSSEPSLRSDSSEPSLSLAEQEELQRKEREEHERERHEARRKEREEKRKREEELRRRHEGCNAQRSRKPLRNSGGWTLKPGS
jgi:hypothetical protein